MKEVIALDKIITFPHLGDYYIPFSYILKKTTNCKIMPPPKITKRKLVRFL